MSKEEYIAIVDEFLGGDNNEIEYKFQYGDYLVFLCTDKNLEKDILTGLPIFVLVNGRGPRFADYDETMRFMAK